MPFEIPIELKIQLVEIGNWLITALQAVCLLAVLYVAAREFKHGKKREYRSRQELAASFIFGILTTLFFFYLVGVPWREAAFWISGASGLVFGYLLTLITKPSGLVDGKIHIKNSRFYGLVWALTVIVGEFFLSFVDPKGTGASASLLFGLMVLVVITIVNFRHFYRYRRPGATAAS